MLSTLPKHRGANGPVIALCLLVVTTAVVLFTQPTKTPALHEDTRRVEAVAPAPDPLPAASLPAPTPVEKAAPSSNSVSGTGIIGYDESKTSHLAAPVAGWLQKSRTKWLGRRVRAGETLGVIYSPQVYLTSVDVLHQMREYHPTSTLDAQRTQLLRWGMPPWTLTKMQSSKVPERSVPLIARVNGIVVAEQGASGGFVDPYEGIEYFTITDPTKYWLYIDVPAADAARLKLNAGAKVWAEGMEKPVAGRIGYIFKRVEGGMRSLRIDIQSRTPIKIGSTASAEIKL